MFVVWDQEGDPFKEERRVGHVENHHHHHKHQGLDPLVRSVSRVTAARANASSVFQLFFNFPMM